MYLVAAHRSFLRYHPCTITYVLQMANRLSLQKYFKTRIVPREERDFRVVHYALQSIFIFVPAGDKSQVRGRKKESKNTSSTSVCVTSRREGEGGRGNGAHQL